MATSDLIDEIALANYLVKKRGGKGFLDDKVLIGSMNRTGLAGTEHEMMDRPSSYMTGKRIKDMNLDAPSCSGAGSPAARRPTAIPWKRWSASPRPSRNAPT